MELPTTLFVIAPNEQLFIVIPADLRTSVPICLSAASTKSATYLLVETL